MAGQELSGLRTSTGSAFPSSPAEGWLHAKEGVLYHYTGTEWRSAAGVTGTGTGTIACRLATAVALAAYTRTTNVIEANANGAMATIDGVAPAANDYLLLKNGAAEKDNGVWKVTSLGGAGSKWKMERALEMDSSAECIPGMVITIAEGTQNGGVEFALLTTGAITLNTTALIFGYAGAWTNATIGSGWADYSATDSTIFAPAYRKSRDGKVHLRGLAGRASGSNATVFTLPTGFRPSKRLILTASINVTTVASVEITSAGAVNYLNAAGAVGFLTLDGLSFYAD